MNVTEDLTSTKWKHFVGKNEIVRESRSSFKKPLPVLNTKTQNTFLKARKAFYVVTVLLSQ